MRQFVLRVLMVIGLTSGLAFATVPGAAQAETAGQFGSTATLIASGVGINVPVTYICPPDGSVASLEVSVTQAVRGVLVRGSGSTSPLTCDDTQHTVVTSVFASGSLAFAKSDAFAQSNLAPCVGCFGGVTFSATITVRKK